MDDNPVPSKASKEGSDQKTTANSPGDETRGLPKKELGPPQVAAAPNPRLTTTQWVELIVSAGWALVLWAEFIECRSIDSLWLLFGALLLFHVGICHPLSKLLRSVALGLAAWVLLAIAAGGVVYKNSHPIPGHSFSVQIEEGFTAPKREYMPMFFVGNAPTPTVVFPVYSMVFVLFTNLKPTSYMIESYAVETQTTNGEWKAMHTIYTYSVFWQLYSVPLMPDGLKHAHRIQLIQPAFNNVMAGRNIGPGETIKGWMFLQIPKEGVGRKLRLRIRDATGLEATEPIASFPAGEMDVFLGGIEFHVGEEQNLSDIPWGFMDEYRPR